MSTLKFPTKPLKFREKNFTLLQTRPFRSLSMDTIEAINLITLDLKTPPQIVGSYKYIVHEYPADIDLFEEYDNCCGLEEATHDVAKKFRVIAENLSKKGNIYLGDFKAGVDDRYEIDIGTIQGYQLHAYDPIHIRKAIIKLKDKGLITKQEMVEWLRLVVDQPSVLEYDELRNTVRSRYVVRWTLDEIIAGRKRLPLDKEITLEDALAHKSVVKIDIWTCLNKRYVEMTNWYMLTYTDANGKKHNLSQKPEKYETSLVYDIRYYSNESINKFMKLAKRIWLYAVLKKDKKLLISLYPLFSSGASKMYQILGETETIKNILKHVEKPKMDTIIENFEDWKTRLGTIMSDILPVSVAHAIFVKINEMLRQPSKIQMIHTMEDIEERLNHYINRYVRFYFKKIKLNVDTLIEH